MRKPIHEYSLRHVLLSIFIDFYFHIFFRKVTIKGKENIPKGEPVLFAVNHQCTLMDPFAVIFTIRKTLVFMARADIFKNPTAAKILRFCKIIPIFRMRDGIKNLTNNDSSFEDAVGTLLAKGRLVLLPEGSHFGQKRLRSLKKGLARIAFQAEEQSDFELGIKVIPVGIDYSDYIKFGSKVLVEYGEAFTLESYFDEYKEQPQKAMNRFMGDLKQKMIPTILNIDDAENYDGIKACCDLYTNNIKSSQRLSHYDERLNAQKVSNLLLDLKENDEKEFTEIINKSLNVQRSLEQLNLRDWVLNKPKYSVIGNAFCRFLQILLSPLFLIGYIANALPFNIPVYLTKKVKDPLFLSSIRVALGAVVFTLYYIIVLIVLGLSLPSWWFAFLYIATMVITGLMSYPYYRWYVKTSAKIRYNKYRRKNSKLWIDLIEDHNMVLEFIQKVL